MLLERIEKNLIKIQENLNKDNFIYDFLEAYEQPKSSIKRLKDGDYNLSKKPNEVIWKKKIYFYSINENQDVHDTIDTISKSELIEKNKIRFIIVTDFKEFLSVDKNNSSTLDINFCELSKSADFFLPLLGLEKAETFEESAADIKAAYKMGQLYDFLIRDNRYLLTNNIKKQSLNFFFSKLLFCFFAEDSLIFKNGLFTNSIISHTKEDGSDLSEYLKKLFDFLNTKDRKNFPDYLNEFPYVNGELFNSNFEIPKFSKESRKIIIESGHLDWGAINPDILGSMMQAVVSRGVRQEFGMHYTSVNNIMKVIKPLFLDNLYNELELANSNEKDLKKILKKIYNIKIFDPACGSGNFLVISYKELYKLEIEILKRIKNLDKNLWLVDNSYINLKQFTGIEIDDYANKAARLSMWIAQHQMNTLYNDTIKDYRPTLPLSPSANIITGNSNTLNWADICKLNKKDDNIFIIGNPPYLGSSLQKTEQKNDLDIIFKGKKNYKNLDYISCWFIKAAELINNYPDNVKVAFISTESICQGEQVSMLWPHILKYNLEIGFCYTRFKWSNNAKFNAGITCIIICLRKISNSKKYIFSKTGVVKEVANISPYLHEGKNIYVEKRSLPLCDLPKMMYGNKAVDGGNLILNEFEKNELLKKNYLAAKYIRPYVGADDYINGKKRYCLWINDNDLNQAILIPEIKKRISKVTQMRMSSKDEGANKLAKKSHQFRDMIEAKNNLLIIPSTTSGIREYIPIGFLDKNFIISNSSYVIYDAPVFIFSILSSKMHLTWSFFVAGYLGTSVRYTSGLCYNTFPIKKLTLDEKFKLEQLAYKLIDQREEFSQKTLHELYDPNKMPLSLKKIHQEIDSFVDQFYSREKIHNHEERIKILFDAYENIIKGNMLI